MSGFKWGVAPVLILSAGLLVTLPQTAQGAGASGNSELKQGCTNALRNYAQVSTLETMCNYPYSANRMILEDIQSANCGQILSDSERAQAMTEGADLVHKPYQAEGMDAYCERMAVPYLQMMQKMQAERAQRSKP